MKLAFEAFGFGLAMECGRVDSDEDEAESLSGPVGFGLPEEKDLCLTSQPGDHQGDRRRIRPLSP